MCKIEERKKRKSDEKEVEGKVALPLIILFLKNNLFSLKAQEKLSKSYFSVILIYDINSN